VVKLLCVEIPADLVALLHGPVSRGQALLRSLLIWWLSTSWTDESRSSFVEIPADLVAQSSLAEIPVHEPVNRGQALLRSLLTL